MVPSVYTPAFPLTGNPGDANIVSAQFFINGVLAATFDLATLGLGSHTITYTVDGGEPKAFVQLILDVSSQ
ncbi:MAG: hypothetical protein R2784_09325 [Saprospiraceae bacterium]